MTGPAAAQTRVPSLRCIRYTELPYETYISQVAAGGRDRLVDFWTSVRFRLRAVDSMVRGFASVQGWFCISPR